MGKNFLAKTGPHKVKVIFFSKTGERASPFVRQISRNYWAYASFAFVLWREEESSIWWNTFEVESAPAIVFLKDPGVKPVVYYGSFNNSRLSEVMEQNKLQELPQLRSVTSMELGCDARGYSRAGSDTTIWYCVILAGRLSPELNKMRETMRRVQETLLSDDESNAADTDQSLAPAAVAFRNKRLTFAWLDGEAQDRYCSFYLFSETSFETCGARRDMSDVPRLFIVRYKRNTTEDEAKIERKPRNIWDAMQEQEVDPASQLVVRYNGSDEIPQIAKWVSEIIQDGDSKDLPFYRAKTPELVPEDSEPLLTRSAQSLFSKSIGMKQRIRNIMGQCYDYLGDPRIGPALLLAALMSFGTIWLMRGQQRAHPSQSGQPGPSANEDENRPARRKRAKQGSNEGRPPSITDEEPKDAYQMPLLDSDSD
ncbi:J domain-containing protein [Citrus sinensis]|nr:J domain-containing protein [Citrus sinensis]